MERKDWELVLKNNQEEKEKVVKSYEMAIPQFDCIIELAKKKISELPEPEEDPKPEGVDELTNE